MLIFMVAIVLVYNCYPSTALEVPRKLLNDGNKIPVLGLGTFSDSKSDERNLDKTIRWAIEEGYRHIDTAAAYGNEIEIGRGINFAIKRNLVTREELFITTKLPLNKHPRHEVLPALRKSLVKLNLTYVDLYLIHAPISKDSNLRPTFVDYIETWQGMEEAKELGLTKSIGVSNFNVDQINRLLANSKVKPAVNQIEVNPNHIRKTLVTHCQKHGIAVTAYSPLGFLVPRPSNTVDEVPSPKPDDPVLKEIGQKYKKTPVQIVLRYLIDRDLIPIPKSSNRTHLTENINIFDFHLTPQEVDLISKFNRGLGRYGWV